MEKSESARSWTLRTLPGPARFLCAIFLISVSLAYAVALLFVFVQSEMRPAGIAEQFRGDGGTDARAEASGAGGLDDGGGDVNPDDPPGLGHEWKSRHAGMRFAKPLREMILTTHVHLLSISMLFFLVGALFSAASFPERGKPWILGAGFAGLIGGYAAMWATRYLHPGFSAAVFACGALQAMALSTQILFCLWDLSPMRHP